MQFIHCPFCGLRSEVEFSWGGESHIARPESHVSDDEWADYLFNRNNTAGAYAERWCHYSGCGKWFNMLRDTETNEVLAVYKMSDIPPGGES